MNKRDELLYQLAAMEAQIELIRASLKNCESIAHYLRMEIYDLKLSETPLTTDKTVLP